MRKPSNLDYVTQPKKIQEKDSSGDKMHEGFRFAWQIWFFRSGEARRVALTGYCSIGDQATQTVG